MCLCGFTQRWVSCRGACCVNWSAELVATCGVCCDVRMHVTNRGNKDYACESSKRCGAVGGATVSGPVHIRNVRTYVTCMYVHLYSAGGTRTTHISSLHLRMQVCIYTQYVCTYIPWGSAAVQYNNSTPCRQHSSAEVSDGLAPQKKCMQSSMAYPLPLPVQYRCPPS